MFDKFQQLIKKILEANIAGDGGCFTPAGSSADFGKTPMHGDMSIVGKTSVQGPKKKGKIKKSPIFRRNLPKGEL